MEPVLPVVWFFLLGFTLILFIILDGADLGIGVLCLGASEQDRSNMMANIGPLWYANETWLVIAGAVLFGAFPLAYSIILSSLYIPVMTVLFGLILRAVSIEFRGHSERKRLWEVVFGCGSLLAIIGQGFILGGILSSVRIENGQFAGGPWDWLNWTSIVIAAGVTAAYSMLGASYIAGKMEAEARLKNRRLLKISASVALGLLILAIAVLTLFATPLSTLWVHPPRLYFVLVFLLAAISGFVMLLRSSNTPDKFGAQYFWSIVVFLSAVSAIISGIFPFFIPFSLTISNAAASSQTLIFMLFGMGPVLPIIVVYNLYVRGVFSGKKYGDHSKDGY